MDTPQVTNNTDQRLYVIPCGKGYSCLGFDVCKNRAEKLATWLGVAQPTAIPGTMEYYYQYQKLMDYALATAKFFNRRCEIELTPQLIGLEGRRVEVLDAYGERRRFQVGKSTGWMPCHIELYNSRSNGGGAVTGAPFKEVRVVK